MCIWFKMMTSSNRFSFLPIEDYLPRMMATNEYSIGTANNNTHALLRYYQVVKFAIKASARHVILYQTLCKCEYIAIGSYVYQY